MSRKALIIACYRSLLRWSQIAETMPIQFKREHLKLFCPQMADSKLTLEDPQTFRNIIRWSFKTNSALLGEEAIDAQTKAMNAMRLMNSVYRKQIEELEQKRNSHLDLKGIKFSIGQVIQNHVDGYRGVVYGWDRVCQHPQYITNPSVDFLQPFYSIIPDENDCIRSFGGPRMFQYVAQEDLKSTEHPCRVANRSLNTHFVSYDPIHGRYIPTNHLQYEYPDDYAIETETEDLTIRNEITSKAAFQKQSMKKSNSGLVNQAVHSADEEIDNEGSESSGTVSEFSSEEEDPNASPKVEGSDRVH